MKEELPSSKDLVQKNLNIANGREHKRKRLNGLVSMP
jgi:hypothetical protein